MPSPLPPLAAADAVGLLSAGSTYRIASWSGVGGFRRLVKRAGTYLGTAERTSWDGSVIEVLEFRLPGGRVVSVRPADLASATPAEDREALRLMRVQRDHRRATLQRVVAQENLRRVLA